MDANIERVFAGRWIAGPKVDDAIKLTKHLNSKGISSVINFLGEELTYNASILNSVETYMHLIYKLKIKKLNAAISVKPTQLGLAIDYPTFESNYLKIANYARQNGIFVWLDMEEPRYIDSTIRACLKARKLGNTGICIQAYLKRSQEDVKRLQRHNAIIRLVKGAYGLRGGPGLSRRKIDSNYEAIMQALFQKSKRFMIATHDQGIIDDALRLNKKYRRNITYAMLNGIRNKYAVDLARSGEKIALYVPFGTEWVSYSVRRLREAGHISLIMRSIFESQSI